MSHCNTSYCFNGVTSINQDLLLNIVEANIKTFLDWGFLNIGAWFDAELNQDTIYSNVNQQSRLLPVADEQFVDGQIWQGIRKDWVFESGAHPSGQQPILISGLTVDGVFHPYPSGDFSINYPDGYVIFDNPIAIGSDVEMEYSYRNIQVYRASDAEWFSQLQYDTFNNSNPDIQRMEDGNWSIAGNHRIQLPAIIIDPISRSNSLPYEIGSYGLVVSQDIGMYVLAETKNERNKIIDILRLQQGITIQMYDTNLVSQNQAYPLNEYLDLNPSGLMYPALTQTFPHYKCYFRTINLFEIVSLKPNLHQGLARATVEIIV